MTNLSGANLHNGAAVGPQGEGRHGPSSFPSYPVYKDSGVEWLGEVPEHWMVQPLKRAIAKIESGTSVNAADYPAEPGSYGVLKTSCVYTGQFDWRENKTVDDEDLNRVSCPLKIDTLVVSRMNTPDLVGATGLVTDAPVGIFLPDRLWQVYFEENQSTSFVFYFTKAPEYREQVKNSCSGTSSSMQNLGQDDFRALLFVAPPVSEQTKIARFLDHETARIDALIEEQQRLIELLKEKRQAVISHAVTKGLDPTVPMKDSGVEWLGDVPAHWTVRKLKNLISVRGGSTPSKEVERYWDGDIPWVSPKDMKSERISNSIDHVSDSAVEDGGLTIVRSGSILIVVRGMILIHSVPVAITDVDVTINQDMKAMTPCAELSSDYLSLLLKGVRDAVFQYIDSSAHGTRKLEWERFELMDLPIPSHTEQIRIVSTIEMQKRAIDELTKQAASAITLMQERRSALISAAVTGKIDVRGWQPPVSTQAPELEAEAV
jgi:type I restriction enzyme S subunit